MNPALSSDSNILRADPSTIQNKFLVGYQGWFTCHGDGEPVGPGHHGWLHWFTYPVPDGGNLNIDLWPDTSEYSPSELYPAPGFKHNNGDQAFLFSSRHPKTVQRHFHWMAQNGVDGAFLQRFVGQCDLEQGNHGIRSIRDEVGDRVKEAAEKEGRVFAIMYDVAGVQSDRVQKIIEEDWRHLLYHKGILDSPNYLREGGKPVIAIWGFGFADSNHTPHQLRAITQFLRSTTPGGAYIMAGTPAHWRSSQSDADRNPEFVSTWMESFDAISPWTVGRYSDQQSTDRFAEDRVKGDVEFIEKWEREKGRHVDYVPVVHPGGSAVNMSQGKWEINGAPRQGGRFLWRQLYNVRRYGAKIVYGAMWDEYDEGTNFIPVVSHKSQLPHDEQGKFPLMALDVDGYDLPSDWYMRVAGLAAEGFRGQRKIGEEFPEKELRDWWSTRPKYEQRGSGSASGSGLGPGQEPGKGQTYEQWLASVQQTKEGEELPPPPYSLEADARAGTQSVLTERPAPPLSTRPTGPPPVQRQSRPQAGDAVTGLADDLSRQRLSPPPGPPPVHPSSRPSYMGSPPVHPSSRPAPGHRPAGPPIPVPDISTADGPWSNPQPVWPPPEWGTGPRPPPQSSYPHSQLNPGRSSYGYPGSGPNMPGGFGFEMQFPQADMSPAPSGGYGPGYIGGESVYGQPEGYGHSQPSPHPTGFPVQSDPPSVPPRLPSGPPPPHPANYPSPSSQPSGSGNGPLNLAWGAVDRFAGQDRRRKLEKSVHGITQSGSKFFNKLTK
ncbi:hypothetical protein EW146_g3615 [Bondarzewia mesenterica]|uniref:Xylosidase/arabinosidase n=1 Tax=Bondarzewia mesenterica TaxID=1095465 RepID=A0A4S4LXK7_9AGAM|nr:hypothetical protein EW146_g3615 [Bondarzewia mesenterica]